MDEFTHLHVHSTFSLLDGAAPPGDLARWVAAAGMEAVAVTDHNTLAGAVRFYKAARKAGVRPLIGVEFTVELADPAPLPLLEPVGHEGVERVGDARADTTTDYTRYAHLVLLAQDNEGYANLCRLVTCARLGLARYAGPFSESFAQVDRKHPVLRQEHLREYGTHLIGLSGCEKGEVPRRVAAGQWRQAREVADYYHQVLGLGNFYVELHNHLLPHPQRALRYKLESLAQMVGLPVVATNNAHYVDRHLARAQDVLVCMRALQTVNEYHPDRKTNAEYGLKLGREMAELFADQPQALANTVEIARRCDWSLDLEHFHFPRFVEPGAPEDAAAMLRRLCTRRALELYPEPRERVWQRLEHELKVIGEQGLCDYFLIVWDICRFSRSRGIMTTGRGSAGDSIVSYLLDITGVDPLAHDLLFERFLNSERRQMPDIDVDFDSRRRDEVNAYVYERYGPERVAAVCTVNTFRARSAVREVGKALGMEEREIGQLAETLPHVRASEIARAAERFPEVRDANLNLADKGLLLELCEQISGFPRHLSVHVGGLVIGAEPLTNITALSLAAKGIVIAEFDKDDVEALGLVKMDILGLRIHTAISDCRELVRARWGHELNLDEIPLDDEKTFELLRSTDTVGLFQLESPGQRNLLGRAQPREFEEVISNISLFRPGPVQSDMIRPYLRRRHGLEPVVYPHPALEPIMRRTYGVLIYQEQVLEIAAAIAGFTLGEADQLRRLMTSDRSHEEMLKLGESFISKSVARGVEQAVAEEVFRQVSGFAAYGFCKAHAACFGLVSYQTAWLKAHYPAEFLAGILSAQPMGFYPPRTIAEDARRLGIGILPPSVNHSFDRYTVEGPTEQPAIRVGLRLLRGMSAAGLGSILEARRQDGPFLSLEDFCQRTHVSRPVTENLILLRAFDFTGLPEQELLWRLAVVEGAQRKGRVRAPAREAGGETPGDPSACQWRGVLGLEEDVDGLLAQLPELEGISEVNRVALDLGLAGVSTTGHPFRFWRRRLQELEVTPSTRLYKCRDGDRVRVAGIVVARARPPTRSGKTAIFISLEDEAGLVDVAVFEECYQRCGRALYASPVLCVEGKLTRQGALDLSVTAQNVMGLGSWRDFERPLAVRPARERLQAPQDGGRSQTRERLTHTGQAWGMRNQTMPGWDPRPNPKVGDRRG